MRRLIIFLVRKRLGVPKYARFRFVNQKNKCEMYTFESDRIMKRTESGCYVSAGVGLNWLLDKECKSSIVLV